MARKAPKPIKPEKNKGGRPSKYEIYCKGDPIEFPELVFRLYAVGAQDDDFCELMGISVPTLHNWCFNYPEFFNARKKGKYEYDIKQVYRKGLLRRATGYDYVEETSELRPTYAKNPETGAFEQDGWEMMVIKSVTKEVLPDPTSIFFFLQNRDKEEWQPVHKLIKQETTIKGGVEHTHKQEEDELTENISELTSSELQVLGKAIEKTLRDDEVFSGEGTGPTEPSRFH